MKASGLSQNLTNPLPKLGTTHIDRTINDKNLEFALKQRDAEILAERLSPAFGPDLLLGMYSMPIRVIPKPRSTDFHLVTDHSTGEFTLNNYIAKSDSSI